MDFITLLIAAGLVVCLLFLFVAMFLSSSKNANAQAQASMLLEKANRELRQNPSRLGLPPVEVK
jgi:flagellar basal body-associated protein FliL